MQLLPFALIGIISFIAAWRLFRKLGMSWAWALFAFVPFAGQIIQLYAAAYGRRAGIIAASLLAIGIIAPMIKVFL